MNKKQLIDSLASYSDDTVILLQMVDYGLMDIKLELKEVALNYRDSDTNRHTEADFVFEWDKEGNTLSIDDKPLKVEQALIITGDFKD